MISQQKEMGHLHSQHITDLVVAVLNQNSFQAHNRHKNNIHHCGKNK